MRTSSKTIHNKTIKYFFDITQYSLSKKTQRYENVTKGPSTYYVILERGALLTDKSNRVEQQNETNRPLAFKKWPFGFVFGVQLGLRQTQALMKTKKNKKNPPPPPPSSYLLLQLVLPILIRACVYRRPSWTPKTKPNGHFPMAGWFRFLCSTRLLMSVKKCPI